MHVTCLPIVQVQTQIWQEARLQQGQNKEEPTLMRLSLQFLQPCRDLRSMKSARRAPKRVFHTEEEQEKTPSAILCLCHRETRLGMNGRLLGLRIPGA